MSDALGLQGRLSVKPREAGDQRMEALLEQIKAMSDGTRLKILKLVERQELCVCQIVPIMGLSQPTISTHLGKLKRAGLVKERRRGQWAYYSMNRESLAQFGKALEAFFSAQLEEIPEMRANALRLAEELAKGDPCPKDP